MPRRQGRNRPAESAPPPRRPYDDLADISLARRFGHDPRQITGLIASCNPLKQNHIECPEFRRTLALDRCSFLKSSVLGFAGLALPDLLRADFSGRPRSALPPEETSQELF